MFKMVNGEVIEMTAAEIAEYNAQQPTEEAVLLEAKNSLVGAVNTAFAAAYDKWSRFSFEYLEREKVAREYQSGGYVGTPDGLISSFASNVGISSEAASVLIIAQADALRSLLKSLGALRMDKYKILNATTLEAAQAEHATIMNSLRTTLANAA
jgi:hypothetical protein